MLRKLLRAAAVSLLTISLFMLAIAGATTSVFGTPENIKKVLNDSGVYDNIVNGILEESKKATDQQDGNLPLDDPALQSTVTSAFPPSEIKGYTESFIDGLYAWLNGETPTPVFTIDLTEAKQRLVDGAGNYAASRFEGLPVCTLEQLQAMGTDVDPFQAPCRPPGLTAAAISAQAQAELQNNQELLKETVITADSLPKDQNGKTVVDNISAAPDVFRLLSWSPWLIGIAALLLAVAIIFLSDSKRQGFQRVGLTLAIVGAVLMVSVLISNRFFDELNKPGNLIREDSAFTSNITTGLESLNNSYNQALLLFYVTYLTVGVVTLLVAWFIGRSAKPAQEATKADDKPAAAPPDKPEAEQVSDPPDTKKPVKPKPTPKKVQ